MMRRRSWAVRAVMMVMLFGLLGAMGGQQRQSAGQTSSGQGNNQLPPLGPELPPAIAAKQEKMRNDDRQKRLVSDTDKLLALATQLHEDVAKTDKNVLSLDVIKRADEIEKLAHSVKERMRNS